MPEVSINYWAVVASAAAAFALGGIWYGPLFGKKWGQLLGWTQEKMDQMKSDPALKKQAAKGYVVQFLASLVMACVLAHFLDYANATTLGMGVQGAFWAWLGFIATTFLGKVLWESKPWALYFIDAGYYLVSLMTMGSILALWQ